MRRSCLRLAAISALALLTLAAIGWRIGWDELWASGDQRGRWLMNHGRYAEAAQAFDDPLWRGVALMRGVDFKAAEQAFAGLDTPLSAYDQGNALVMQGKYDEAIRRYDRALALRPGWADAEANRTLARLRADLVRKKGGNTGDEEQKADEVVYDKDKKNNDGMNTRVEAGMSDAAARDLWLKRVQTRPADFLKARFLYQLQEKKP